MRTEAGDSLVRIDSIEGSYAGTFIGSPMPRIPDDWLDVTFYLYPDFSHAERGEGVGGTGFFCAGPDPDPAPDGAVKAYWAPIFAVTNRHVIESGFCCVRANKRDGSVSIFEIDERSWVFPDDGSDIAISTSFGTSVAEVEYKSVPGLMTKDKIKKFDIGIGDDVFLVGRFIEWDGKQSNTPVARFGNVAQMPQTEDENGKILAEVRSIGGFSGSPVFVHVPPNNTSEPKRLNRPDNVRLIPQLLGINSANTAHKSPIREASGRENGYGYYIKANTGLAVVEPAWKLVDLMESEVRKMTKTNGAVQAAEAKASRPKPSEKLESVSAPKLNADISESDEVLKRMLNTPPKPHDSN